MYNIGWTTTAQCLWPLSTLIYHRDYHNDGSWNFLLDTRESCSGCRSKGWNVEKEREQGLTYLLYLALLKSHSEIFSNFFKNQMQFPELLRPSTTLCYLIVLCAYIFIRVYMPFIFSSYLNTFILNFCLVSYHQRLQSTLVRTNQYVSRYYYLIAWNTNHKWTFIFFFLFSSSHFFFYIHSRLQLVAWMNVYNAIFLSKYMDNIRIYSADGSFIVE